MSNKCDFCGSNQVLEGKLAHKESCPLVVGRKFTEKHSISGETFVTINLLENETEGVFTGRQIGILQRLVQAEMYRVRDIYRHAVRAFPGESEAKTRLYDAEEEETLELEEIDNIFNKMRAEAKQPGES